MTLYSIKLLGMIHSTNCLKPPHPFYFSRLFLCLKVKSPVNFDTSKKKRTQHSISQLIFRPVDHGQFQDRIVLQKPNWSVAVV
jgi:hypothetical protein